MASNDSGTPEIWIHDDVSHRETFQQVFAFQFRMNYVESLQQFNAWARDPGRVKPAMMLLDIDAKEALATEWLESFQAGFKGGSQIVVVSKNDNLERMREMHRRGAADYLLKPIKPNELIFRCECLLSQTLKRPFEILPTTIDTISISGLTFKERQLLAIFVLSPDRSVHRKDLFGAIWKDISVNKKTLDVHLFNLRRKLHPLGFDIICQSQIYRLRKV